MLDSLKLYIGGGLLALIVILGGTSWYLWGVRADLKAELVVKEAELAAQQRATLAVEKVAKAAAERAASLQPIRVEVQSAPVGGCVGDGTRAALRGLRERQAGPANPGQP